VSYIYYPCKSWPQIVQIHPSLATRLKRLSERLSQDVSLIYKESNLNFEAKGYLVLELLSREKVMAITEISTALQLSQRLGICNT
jgi:hypothetical protein